HPLHRLGGPVTHHPRFLLLLGSAGHSISYLLLELGLVLLGDSGESSPNGNCLEMSRPIWMRQHPVKVSNYYPLEVIPNQVTSGEPPPRLGGHPRLSSPAPCLHTAGNGP